MHILVKKNINIKVFYIKVKTLYLYLKNKMSTKCCLINELCRDTYTFKNNTIYLKDVYKLGDAIKTYPDHFTDTHSSEIKTAISSIINYTTGHHANEFIDVLEDYLKHWKKPRKNDLVKEDTRHLIKLIINLINNNYLHKHKYSINNYYNNCNYKLFLPFLINFDIKVLK